MLFLYRVYQICVMLPLMLAATVITALTAIAGASLGAGRWAGYYPERIWSRIMCWLAFVRVRAVGRDNIDPRQSYIFVANHQGAYDIFTIYGWLGHQFRWMMKKELRRIPLVGYACERIQQIYVDRSTPSALRHTMERAERLLGSGLSVVSRGGTHMGRQGQSLQARRLHACRGVSSSGGAADDRRRIRRVAPLQALPYARNNHTDHTSGHKPARRRLALQPA